jgi:hypothetical protein
MLDEVAVRDLFARVEAGEGTSSVHVCVDASLRVGIGAEGVVEV